MKHLNAVVFDLDAGQPEDEIFPSLLKSGWNFIYYTSHSNGKSRTGIGLGDLRKFVNVPNGGAYQPEDQHVRDYLSEKKGYHPSVVETAMISKIPELDAFDDNAKDSKKSVDIEVAHAPIHKCRIVFPLAQDYVIPEGDEDAKQALEDFESIVNHIGKQLGFLFDGTSGQPGRAFFAARCKSYDNYRAVIGGSKPLVLPVCTEEMREKAGFKNQEKRKAALEARQAKRGGKVLEGVPDTTKFMRLHGDNFDGLQWLKAIDWETRGEVRGGKVAIRCPNAAEHSEQSADDAACVAINPDGGYGSNFMITCLHDHCRHLETRDFLAMVCEEVIESTVEGDLPALESFLFDDLEANDAPATKKDGKPTYAKLKKLLGKKPYAVNQYGWIEFDEVQKNGKDVKTYPVCKAFDVIDMARDESGEDWGLRIEFEDYDGKKHLTRISLSDIHKSNSDLRPRLAGMGLEISTLGKGFNGLFARLASVKERSIVVSKAGWRPNRKAFICPDGKVVGEINGETPWLENHFTNQQAGTLEGQLKAWELAFKYGGDHHLVGCLGGVAGSLVQYTRLGSTPVIGLTGSSSHGKSTSMALAAGCWGWPQILEGDGVRGGLFHNMRTTPNAVEFLAARSNGTVLCLDDTAHMDAKELERLVFMIAEGKGKTRMTPSQEERGHMNWASCAFISAEIPLAKDIEGTGKQARVGFTARIADINVSGYQPMSKEHYDELKGLLDANYGWIGPAFVKHLIESGKSPEALRKEIDTKAKELAGDSKSPLVERSAKVFALLWVTGELLGEAGLLPDLGEEADGSGAKRIRAIWETYKLSEVAKVLDPVAKAIQTLRQALVTRRDVDVYPTIYKDRTKSRQAVAYYVPRFDPVAKDDETSLPLSLPPVEFYVLKDDLAKLAGGNQDPDVIVAKLIQMGILKRPEPKKKKPDEGKGKTKLTIYHRYVADVGKVDAYRLIFDDPGEEAE